MYDTIGGDIMTKTNESEPDMKIEMERLTTRIEKKMRDDMKRMKNVNWPEKIRTTIKKEILKDEIAIETTSIVQSNKDDVILMISFFLYSVILQQMYQPLKRNLKTMIGDRAKEIETKMLSTFENIGITDRHDKTSQDIFFHEVLLQTLFEENIIEIIEDYIKENFNNSPNKDELALALWHLNNYLHLLSQVITL